MKFHVPTKRTLLAGWLLVLARLVDSTAVGIISVTVRGYPTSLDSDGNGLPDIVEYAPKTAGNVIGEDFFPNGHRRQRHR